ncbi:MAG: efflux RND transporter periplasmic adaptor subunit [Candidatus Obscuribacterales bacterium]|nr:efflux RND transporter periplasmic adaptor subunit [Candidatus Obscuribacterales bacterium]
MQAPEKVHTVQASKEGAEPKSWLITIAIVVICAVSTMFLWLGLQGRKLDPPKGLEESTGPNSHQILSEMQGRDTALCTETTPVLGSAPAQAVTIPGVVEPNQEQLQQVTPLVSGRVEKISVALGDQVKKGALLVEIDSPQVAELHGKLHEAETKLKLAQQNMLRVTQAANRVSVLKAKATLEEAEATLKRATQLVSEGLAAKKDMIAAQAEFERATADFNFQKDISLNREVAEARAELSTAKTEAEHIRDALKALDAQLLDESDNRGTHDISAIQLRAPMTGTVIERFVNPGAGFEAGKPLLTLANTEKLWAIASVPEGKISDIYVGMPAKVQTENRTVEGKVDYIDPRLNEDTRTGRVRVEIRNPDNRIKVGSFVQVVFAAAGSVGGTFVPADAIQTVNGRTVVFIPKGKGAFEPRDVVTGNQMNSLVAIKSGVIAGERVVSKGSFLLKSNLLKDQLGEGE